ncbi:Hypothetical protein R9X50_00130900 [Acrodontium crateriforme]|uniref:Uncharacterized protein n=1 Tax=Acrodontium crateriforme TaxID=150365 RepID=A0AAQ3LYW6_9PEZI|nr:Hypothetical protein R9X50_00130900 [Acrodontium crateriforme]
MLNSRALSELLSRNSDARLCKRWLLMTPNGTLLAYSQPADPKDLRKQAAMAAISWQQQHTALHEHSFVADDNTNASSKIRELCTLTIESDTSNTIVRQVQPHLLLVLHGGVPPRKRTFEPRITAEGPGGEYYSLNEIKTPASGLQTSASTVSFAASTKSTAAASILEMQRKKLDAMASAITAEFHRTGFQMPDESSNKFF